ncbi:MoaD/ThiS family protein [Chloroflexota bacterium]
MGIKVNVPSYMKSFTNNLEIVEVSGNTVGECLSHLVKQYPDMKKQLFSKNGELFEYIIIPVNGESAYPEQLAKLVKDGDELNILLIIGGG